LNYFNTGAGSEPSRAGCNHILGIDEGSDAAGGFNPDTWSNRLSHKGYIFNCCPAAAKAG
jgi:hypothetical protein